MNYTNDITLLLSDNLFKVFKTHGRYLQMFSYEFKDEPKCKAMYANEIKYISFNEFLSKTTSPQYLKVEKGERVP